MTRTTDTGTYAALRAAILSLDLVPGERLSERGLESITGSSRTPVRAALMRLETEGLTRREGRGWQVTPIDLTEIRAVMEYREAVETAAVALAVERAQEAELDALRVIARTELDDDEEGGLRAGDDFHLALAHLSRNPFFVDAIGNALTRLRRTRWLEVRTPQSRAHARAEHREIVIAVAARDVARAQQLVAIHSRGTRDRLLSRLTDERRRLRGHGFSIVESTPPAAS